MRPIVQMLLTIYGEPNSTEPIKYLAAVDNACEGYSDEIQRKAAEHLAANYRSSRYPLPADCRKSCMVVAEEMADANSKSPAKNPYPEWTKTRIAIADNLMRSEAGQRAADNGYALAFHDFCRKHSRPPNRYEEQQIIVKARQFDEAYEAAMHIPGTLGKTLRALGDKMLERRELCASIAHGEIRP